VFPWRGRELVGGLVWAEEGQRGVLHGGLGGGGGHGGGLRPWAQGNSALGFGERRSGEEKV